MSCVDGFEPGKAPSTWRGGRVASLTTRTVSRDISRDFLLTSEAGSLKWAVFAGIAQLVEHDLAKVGVASSSLVSRSKHLHAWHA